MKTMILILFLLSSLDAKVILQNSTIVLADPYNKTHYPKRIPGATIRYYFHIFNDNVQSMDTGRFTTTLDTEMFDLQGSVIMIEADGVLKNSKIDSTTGKIEVAFFELKARQKIVLYFDVVLKA